MDKIRRMANTYRGFERTELDMYTPERTYCTVIQPISIVKPLRLPSKWVMSPGADKYSIAQSDISYRLRCRYHTVSIREVSLRVKRERVRVTSHLGAQFRYTSRSRTLLGFASRRDVSTEKQGHRYQQITRQQSIKRARKQKLMHSA